MNDGTPTTDSESTQRTLWIDVEDLFEYAASSYRPSGIQRLSFELYKALIGQQGNGVRIRFLRRTAGNTAFYSIPWQSVETLFNALASGPGSPPHLLAAKDDPGRKRKMVRFVRRIVPRQTRAPLAGFLSHQIAALRFLKDALLASVKEHKLGDRLQDPPADDEFQRTARQGDVLASFGSPWSEPDFSGLISREKHARGLAFAVLIYDIIPLRRPEWTDKTLTVAFGRWLKGTLPLSDTIFVISHATARDLLDFAREQAMPLAGEPVVIPLGAELDTTPDEVEPDSVPARPLPADGYALIVSTIEARKNHDLLFRIWRKLLLELPRDDVPTLIFAGRVGWLVSDLVQKLENTNFLDGKIIVWESPSDRELSRLYEGCSFTLFPSLYEGWGLPITESLAFGRPCIASNRSSLPEAGGDLARYFDPDDFYGAYETVLNVIRNPEELSRWRERVVREFTPVGWEDTARVVLDEIRRG